MWAVKLGKDSLFSRQMSQRGGDLWARYLPPPPGGDGGVTGEARVLVSGIHVCVCGVCVCVRVCVCTWLFLPPPAGDCDVTDCVVTDCVVTDCFVTGEVCALCS